MRYIFIINGREDKRPVREEVERQVAAAGIDTEIYVTNGIGDGTRYVHLWCDLHRNMTACFVACGGSGTANEVASGIVGHDDMCMAYWAVGGTNDFCKYYPGRDFTTLQGILKGEHAHIDVLRANDCYAINMINSGFSAVCAAEVNRLIEDGVSNPYRKGVARTIFSKRNSRVSITIDGRKLKWRRMYMCDLANGNYTGSMFLPAPDAVIDDGFMDVLFIRPMTLPLVPLAIKYYKHGTYASSIMRHWFKTMRASRVEMTSRDLITLSLDGEILAGTSFVFDVLPKALDIILPKESNI